MRAALLGFSLLVGCGSDISPVTLDGEACVVDDVHIWRIRGAPTGLVSARVDTVDASTTFDPELFLYEVEVWGEGPGGVSATNLLRYNDNALQCAFRPVADYPACPQVLGRTSETVTEDLLLLVGMRAACAGGEVAYELTVDVNGESAEVTFEGTGSVDPYVAEE